MNWTSLPSEDLIRACVEAGSQAAWEEFVRRFQSILAGTVMRTARRFGECTTDLIDDLTQEAFLKICANRCRILREFQPRAPEAIFGLLKTVAFSVTQDHFRGVRSVKRGAGCPEIPFDDYTKSAIGAGEGATRVEREILLAQIDGYLTPATDPQTRERDRRIFWLYYRHGMTARAIAAIPGIGLTQKGVESVIQRLTDYVRSRLAGSKP